MVVTVGRMYQIAQFADCLNCPNEIHRGIHLDDGSWTEWSHMSGGEDCPPVTKAEPINIRSRSDDAR